MAEAYQLEGPVQVNAFTQALHALRRGYSQEKRALLRQGRQGGITEAAAEQYKHLAAQSALLDYVLDERIDTTILQVFNREFLSVEDRQGYSDSHDDEVENMVDNALKVLQERKPLMDVPREDLGVLCDRIRQAAQAIHKQNLPKKESIWQRFNPLKGLNLNMFSSPGRSKAQKGTITPFTSHHNQNLSIAVTSSPDDRVFYWRQMAEIGNPDRFTAAVMLTTDQDAEKFGAGKHHLLKNEVIKGKDFTAVGGGDLVKISVGRKPVEEKDITVKVFQRDEWGSVEGSLLLQSGDHATRDIGSNTLFALAQEITNSRKERQALVTETEVSSTIVLNCVGGRDRSVAVAMVLEAWDMVEHNVEPKMDFLLNKYQMMRNNPEAGVMFQGMVADTITLIYEHLGKAIPQSLTDWQEAAEKIGSKFDMGGRDAVSREAIAYFRKKPERTPVESRLFSTQDDVDGVKWRLREIDIDKISVESDFPTITLTTEKGEQAEVQAGQLMLLAKFLEKRGVITVCKKRLPNMQGDPIDVTMHVDTPDRFIALHEELGFKGENPRKHIVKRCSAQIVSHVDNPKEVQVRLVPPFNVSVWDLNNLLEGRHKVKVEGDAVVLSFGGIKAATNFIRRGEVRYLENQSELRLDEETQQLSMVTNIAIAPKDMTNGVTQYYSNPGVQALIDRFQGHIDEAVARATSAWGHTQRVTYSPTYNRKDSMPEAMPERVMTQPAAEVVREGVLRDRSGIAEQPFRAHLQNGQLAFSIDTSNIPPSLLQAVATELSLHEELHAKADRVQSMWQERRDAALRPEVDMEVTATGLKGTDWKGVLDELDSDPGREGGASRG